MKKFILPMIAVLVVSLISYQVYLNSPKKYSVGECVLDQPTGEIYKLTEAPSRDLNLKTNWVFGPMTLKTEVVKTNPNTQRQLKDKRNFEQDDQAISKTDCPS